MNHIRYLCTECSYVMPCTCPAIVKYIENATGRYSIQVMIWKHERNEKKQERKHGMYIVCQDLMTINPVGMSICEVLI